MTDLRQRFPDEKEQSRTWLDSLQARIWTALPGTVEASFKKGLPYVSVQPAAQGKTVADDRTTKWHDLSDAFAFIGTTSQARPVSSGHINASSLQLHSDDDETVFDLASRTGNLLSGRSTWTMEAPKSAVNRDFKSNSDLSKIDNGDGNENRTRSARRALRLFGRRRIGDRNRSGWGRASWRIYRDVRHGTHGTTGTPSDDSLHARSLAFPLPARARLHSAWRLDSAFRKRRRGQRKKRAHRLLARAVSDLRQNPRPRLITRSSGV